MVTQTKETSEHNAITEAKKIEELKQKKIPGKSTRMQVEYLMDHYPYLEPKDMMEILGKTKASIYTARYDIKKAREKNPKKEKLTIENQATSYQEQQKQSIPTVPLQIPQLETPYEYPSLNEIQVEQPHIPPTTHIDVWDEQPTDLSFVYGHPTPIQVQPTYEIGLSGVDGATVRSLVDILYSKITENKRYRVHFKIEEE